VLDHGYNEGGRIDFVFHSETVLHFQACSVVHCQPVSDSQSEGNLAVHNL